MFKVMCIILLVPVLVYGRAWGPCGNNDPAPLRIHVSNCEADKHQGCVVRRGQPSTLQVQFHTRGNAEALNAQIHALVGRIWFPWTLGPAANVCRSLGLGRCPSPPNTTLVYRFKLTIPGAAPAGTDARVRLRVRNQARKLQFCMLLRVLVR